MDACTLMGVNFCEPRALSRCHRRTLSDRFTSAARTLIRFATAMSGSEQRLLPTLVYYHVQSSFLAVTNAETTSSDEQWSAFPFDRAGPRH